MILGGAADDDSKLKAAQDELESMCVDFLNKAKQFASAARDIVDPKRKEIAKATASGLLLALRNRIHERQAELAACGLSVFISHDRNGSPIRVDRKWRGEIVGYW